MDESSKDKTEGQKEISNKGFFIYMGIVILFGALAYGILTLSNKGMFDRSANDIYSDLKDYQSCKVVTDEVRKNTLNSALICELSPTQQKTPESVQLAQKKVAELTEEIKDYSYVTIKELNVLLEDDFVKKNPERAIDNILAEMKRFDLCLVVSSENKMAVDCSFKENERSNLLYAKNEIDKVSEYYQKQSKINHQLSLIDKKYFTYFNNERNKEIKEVKENADVVSEALRMKARAILEYENLLIEKKTKEIKRDIEKIK